MKHQRLFRAGIICICASVLVFLCWTLWFNSHTWNPVYLPISLSQGSTLRTPDFTINRSGEYEIQIEATKAPGMSDLACLLGIGAEWPARGCHTNSVLRLSWELSSQGKIVSHGSSEQTDGGGGAGVTDAFRDIGSFQARKNIAYSLEVKVLDDGSRLSAARPHLKICAGGTALETYLVLNGLIKLISTVVGIAGIVLISIWLLIRKP
jgi:hypothetical protein